LNFAKIFAGFDFPDKGGGFQGVPRETLKAIFVSAIIIYVKSVLTPGGADSGRFLINPSNERSIDVPDWPKGTRYFR